ncbi:MAG TPA: CHAT domain-containing protein [Pyrinomonadaceae bacterium]
MDRQQIIGISSTKWLRDEQAKVRLRDAYTKGVRSIKRRHGESPVPRCYISHLPEQTDWAKTLGQDLSRSGVCVIERAADVTKPTDFVIVLSTPEYQRAYESGSILATDASLIQARLRKRRLIALTVEKKMETHAFAECKSGILCEGLHYLVTLFDVVLDLFDIPGDGNFSSTRQALHQEWEHITDRLGQAADHPSTQSPGSAPAPKSSRRQAMSASYHDFELHIAADGRTVASSPQGEASAEILTEVPRSIQWGLMLIEKRQTNAKFLQDFGKDLYNWLFPGPIHAHFHQTEAAARIKGAKIRLRLRVEADSIASLPLEFLYRETEGYFLAVNPNTVVARYLDSPRPPERVRRRKGPLHMLAIIADPTDQTRLNPDEWEDILKQSLAEPLKAGLITLRTVKQATRKEIRNALRDRQPNIIQFVGHGIYHNGEGSLALVEEGTGKTWLVNDQTFANIYLGHADRLGLISLATCESAKSDSPQGFSGIAPHLVQRGIPAVVSMYYKVFIKTAQVFLEDFYTAIAAGEPADWAIQSARNAVSQELNLDNREFATPVLYMRAKDGMVLKRP